jgi:hypothetical protein
MAGLALEEAKCHAFFRLCPDLGALIFAFRQKLDRCASPSSGGCVVAVWIFGRHIALGTWLPMLNSYMADLSN